jgi:hypothetical protein
MVVMTTDRHTDKAPPKQQERPAYAEVLERRRKELGKSKEELSAETNDVLYRQFLRRVLIGEKPPDQMTYQQLSLLARYFEWSIATLARVFGLETEPPRDELPGVRSDNLAMVPVYYPPSMGIVEKIPTGSAVSFTHSTLKALREGGSALECYTIDDSVQVSGGAVAKLGFQPSDIFGVTVGLEPYEDDDVACARSVRTSVVYILLSSELNTRTVYYSGADRSKPDVTRVTPRPGSIDLVGVVRYRAGVL